MNAKLTAATILDSIKRMPDILDVIAALSSDAIPTPPLLARALLDTLPEEVWIDPDLKWLDPAAKSGSILREVALRLMVGLQEWQPNAETRAQHILSKMLYGCGITQVHGDMTRRSLYISRDASSPHSIVKFDTADGNVPFVQADHDYVLNKEGKAVGSCRKCSAPVQLERGNSRENYAYAFIHNAYPTEEMKNMKFDVIVGNPPYQTGDGRTSESPIYQHFIERALDLKPKFVAMIVPSRWFMGGKGLDDFRFKMIKDRRIRKIVDNPMLYDCFPGVSIKGGVNYFLWDRDYDGDCEFSTRINGQITSTVTRDLRKGDGVVIRDNNASSIVTKCSPSKEEMSLTPLFSSQFPFGQSITTNFAGAAEKPFKDSIPLIFGSHVGYVKKSQIEKNIEWVDKYKVIIPKAADGNGREVSYVLGEPMALAPGSACTQTYLVAGVWKTKKEAENYAYFLTTKLVRFLLLQRKSTQDVRPDRFRFVPQMDMTKKWLDEDLYAHFKLTKSEISYIESIIHKREPILSLNSAIPETHLPGGVRYRPPGARAETEGPIVDGLEEDDE
jgi:site-specific DNA-methyltransferase (adenine-specific)